MLVDAVAATVVIRTCCRCKDCPPRNYASQGTHFPQSLIPLPRTPLPLAVGDRDRVRLHTVEYESPTSAGESQGKGTASLAFGTNQVVDWSD